MTAVTKKLKEKTGGGVQVFCAGIEPLQTDMFLPQRNHRRIKGATQFWKSVTGKGVEVKTRVEHQPQKCKAIQKLQASFWGEFQEGGTHLMHNHEDETSKHAC